MWLWDVGLNVGACLLNGSKSIRFLILFLSPYTATPYRWFLLNFSYFVLIYILCETVNRYQNLINRQDKKAQLFSVFKSKRVISLCSHMAQWDAVNKKSNVSTISYYIYIDWLMIKVGLVLILLGEVKSFINICVL